MSLAAGTRLGPYEIVALLGAGGMGEVYRALDGRLGREVAVKVLSQDVTADRSVLARFEQEARAASSLNHPNIITVHDFGKSDGMSFLSMELVDGRSLRDLLVDAPFPLKKTLQIAAQTAEGLAAAHERGIVHRDLKPENVMVTKDGLVKVLDFGLAKSVGLKPSPDDETLVQASGTHPGTVLGTIGYMSPEQASGKPVDFRTDQFSLGTILYEMVTGKRAFKRATPVETLTAIIREEPEPISALDPRTPVALRWIVERCIAKDAGERYASTRDLARDLRNIAEHISELTSTTGALPGVARPRRIGAALAAAAIPLSMLAGFLLHRALAPREQAVPTFRTLSDSGSDLLPAVSPDGQMIAFASERDGKSRIWLKQLATGAEIALTAGEDIAPRFSPDGASILFTRGANSSLYRVAALGGEPRKLIENALDGDFSPDGKRIAFLRTKQTGGNTEISLLVSNADGTGQREILKHDAAIAYSPRWSPDGRWIALATADGGSFLNAPWHVVLARDDGSENRRLDPPERSGALSSAFFTADGKEVVYAQVPGYSNRSGRVVAQSVATGRFRTLFSSLGLGNVVEPAGDGKLVYAAFSSTENLRVQALDPKSGTLAGAGRALTRGNGINRQPAYSNDGERIVFFSNRDGNVDIWEMTKKTGALRRLTDDPADDGDPGFMPDGRLIWASRRSGSFEIWIADADGANARQVTKDGVDAENPSAGADGRWIVYGSYQPAKGGIWKIRPDGTEATRLAAGTIGVPQVSPDGKYVAFVSLDLPRFVGVTVVRVEDGAPTAFSIPTSPRQSNVIAGRARWLRGGAALAYVDLDEEGRTGIYVRDFDPVRDTSATRKKLLGFETGAAPESFGISPDGSEIAIAEGTTSQDLMLVEGLSGLSARRR